MLVIPNVSLLSHLSQSGCCSAESNLFAKRSQHGQVSLDLTLARTRARWRASDLEREDDQEIGVRIELG